MTLRSEKVFEEALAAAQAVRGGLNPTALANFVRLAAGRPVKISFKGGEKHRPSWIGPVDRHLCYGNIAPEDEALSVIGAASIRRIELAVS